MLLQFYVIYFYGCDVKNDTTLSIDWFCIPIFFFPQLTLSDWSEPLRCLRLPLGLSSMPFRHLSSAPVIFWYLEMLTKDCDLVFSRKCADRGWTWGVDSRSMGTFKLQVLSLLGRLEEPAIETIVLQLELWRGSLMVKTEQFPKALVPFLGNVSEVLLNCQAKD